MNTPPLVIIGLDAGDPDLILAWAGEGVLPTIASILARGTCGRLVGPEMFSVHGVWTSFFSGVSVHEHGLYLQRPLLPGTYELKAIHPWDSVARPFWADFRRPLVTIDVPDSHPLAGLHGVQLVNWSNHPTLAPPEARPEGLLSEIRAAVGPPIATDERQGSRRRDRRILTRILRRIEQKGELCRYLLNKGRFDLVVVVFGDSHAAGHRFRKYQNAATAAACGGDLRDAVRQTYEAIDREIGRLLCGFPEPPNVFVVSNSGTIDGYPVGDWMEAFCRELGYQTLIEPTGALGRLCALPRTWRSLLGYRRRLRLQAERLGKSTNWGRTTAFAIPAYYTGYVRVNLKGREPLGVVAPGAEYEALLERMTADFLQLVDEKTGDAVVERVTCTAKLFGGGPPLRLPDLVVDWRHSAALAQRIAHPRGVLVRRGWGRPRGNYHSSSGLVLAAGPSIRQCGRVADLSPLDFAPLFRVLMAEPIAARASGEAIDVFMRS